LSAGVLVVNDLAVAPSVVEVLSAKGGRDTLPVSVLRAPVALGFTVFGRVTEGGVGAAGVTLTLHMGETVAKTTTSASDGTYSFLAVAAGEYSVTPSESGRTFAPASRDVTVSNANVPDIDFTRDPLPPPTFRILGKVSENTSAVAGATLTLSQNGLTVHSVTSAADGTYSLEAVLAGDYTVTPSETGRTFTPASRNVTVTNADVTEVNFTRDPPITTFSVSGTIRGVSGAPVPGVYVEVLLGGQSQGGASTDATGRFSVLGLPPGLYTLQPVQDGFTFTPATRTVTVSQADVVGQDFTRDDARITGTVRDRRNAPLAGVAITVTDAAGGAVATALTGANGTYTVPGLARGTYVLTPALGALTFNPVSRSVTIRNKDVKGQDFKQR
jgi:hypothetical protein